MSNTHTPNAVIHFLDSARGQYIPRDFAQIIKREFLTGVSMVDIDILAEENSNENPDYWELWETVLNNARVLSDDTEYNLHHDGDLWLINYDLMSEQERVNFGFED